MFDIADIFIMETAAEFRFMANSTHPITLGIDQHLVANTFSDWLDKVIDNMKGIDSAATASRTH